MLQIKPILAALKQHKAGTVLIGLQIALTLAIVCNLLFMIHQRMLHVSRPSGVSEESVLTIRNEWARADESNLQALDAADLQLLRRLTGVRDASISYGYPLRNGGYNSSVSNTPSNPNEINVSSRFFTDDHLLPVLDSKLIAGRNFRSDEVAWEREDQMQPAPQVILTESLARKLYPDGSALGKPVYLDGSASPSVVIGIVDRLAGNFPGSWNDAAYGDIVIEPRIVVDKPVTYLISAEPGQLEAITKGAPAALMKLNRLRIIADGTGDADMGVRNFTQVRADAYRDEEGMVKVMAYISIVLLCITAAGIVGLTSFWVGQRRKQIGIRRALGATRGEILSYFLTENLLIGIGAVFFGSLLAGGISLFLSLHFETHRLSVIYLLGGIATLLLLGQCATFGPAWRAAKISPVEATRSG
ncbi:ABC transporter permease [Dyella acidiphila]|uniref:FtsX-like permease family protein n=1 Tax=Dyella acidiphila TaxID=2775866 RepID=A0ABR9GGB9_9GAMM|nr:FtsX-like permease family protein [Dyella acidiphila]MBE1163044.1 FtsX-like permease family protein [Dyella acidiphila]